MYSSSRNTKALAAVIVSCLPLCLGFFCIVYVLLCCVWVRYSAKKKIYLNLPRTERKCKKEKKNVEKEEEGVNGE